MSATTSVASRTRSRSDGPAGEFTIGAGLERTRRQDAGEHATGRSRHAAHATHGQQAHATCDPKKHIRSRRGVQIQWPDRHPSLRMAWRTPRELQTPLHDSAVSWARAPTVLMQSTPRARFASSPHGPELGPGSPDPLRGRLSHGPRRVRGGGTVVCHRHAGTLAGKSCGGGPSPASPAMALERGRTGVRSPANHENYSPIFNSVNRILISLNPEPLDRGIAR